MWRSEGNLQRSGLHSHLWILGITLTSSVSKNLSPLSNPLLALPPPPEYWDRARALPHLIGFRLHLPRYLVVSVTQLVFYFLFLLDMSSFRSIYLEDLQQILFTY